MTKRGAQCDIAASTRGSFLPAGMSIICSAIRYGRWVMRS
jgi:hypothetical protein